MNEREEILARRAELKARFKGLHEEVSAILFEDDPLSINFQTNTDEYEPEVGTILPRLRSCASAEAVRAVVHEELVAWFGAESVGALEQYHSMADRIWAAYQSFTGSRR
jgi:hypothetical protein